MWEFSLFAELKNSCLKMAEQFLTQNLNDKIVKKLETL